MVLGPVTVRTDRKISQSRTAHLQSLRTFLWFINRIRVVPWLPINSHSLPDIEKWGRHYLDIKGLTNTLKDKDGVVTVYNKT